MEIDGFKQVSVYNTGMLASIQNLISALKNNDISKGYFDYFDTDGYRNYYYFWEHDANFGIDFKYTNSSGYYTGIRSKSSSYKWTDNLRYYPYILSLTENGFCISMLISNEERGIFFCTWDNNNVKTIIFCPALSAITTEPSLVVINQNTVTALPLQQFSNNAATSLLVPVPVNDNTPNLISYCPNVFYAPYSSYKKTGLVMINGEYYYTNGIVYMKVKKGDA